MLTPYLYDLKLAEHSFARRVPSEAAASLSIAYMSKFTSCLFPNQFVCWVSDKYHMLASLFSDIFLSPSWKLWRHLSDSHLLGPFLSLFFISRLSESSNEFHLSLEYWTITVTSPILEFSCIYSTHSSRKSHLFRYRWKSNLGARFSLCHLRKSFLLREESLLSPDWLAAKTATDCHLLFSHSPCFLRKC